MPYVFKLGNANGILPYPSQPQIPSNPSGSTSLDRRTAAYRPLSFAILLLAVTEAVVSIEVPDVVLYIVLLLGLLVMPSLPLFKQDASVNSWHKLQFYMLCILDGFIFAGVARLFDHSIPGTAEVVCITTAALALGVQICAITFSQNSLSFPSLFICSGLVLAAAAITGAQLHIEPSVMIIVAGIHLFACAAIVFGYKTQKSSVGTPDPVEDAYDLFLLATFPITAIFYLLSIW